MHALLLVLDNPLLHLSTFLPNGRRAAAATTCTDAKWWGQQRGHLRLAFLTAVPRYKLRSTAAASTPPPSPPSSSLFSSFLPAWSLRSMSTDRARPPRRFALLCPSAAAAAAPPLPTDVALCGRCWHQPSSSADGQRAGGRGEEA